MKLKTKNYKKKHKLLYIGNKLQSRGANPTTIDTLSPLFEEFVDVISVSNRLNYLARFFDTIFTILKNRKEIGLVLIDTYSSLNFYSTLVYAIILRVIKVPYVPFLHGGALPNRLKQSPLFCKMVFKHSVMNIAPSGYLMNAFIEAGFKAERISNYIHIENYAFKHRRQLEPKLLYVRAIDQTYNPVMAIEVLDLVKRKYPEATLCMVGPEKDKSIERVKEKIKNLNVSESVKLTGRLAKEEWIKLSEQFDIFINTTNTDNLPVSLIEAKALGFPVVSTNVGGIPFVIENNVNGFMVPPKNPKAMAEAIITLVENNNLAGKISTQARISAENYDWSKVKKMWIELFEQFVVINETKGEVEV